MKKVLALALALLTVLSIVSVFPVSASAATSWPTLSSGAYCEFTAANTIPVYRNSSCSTRGTASPAKSYNASISAGDVCKIFNITSSYIYVGYPTSSGQRVGYIKRSALFNVSSPSEVVTSASKVTTYKYANSNSYGYISANDKVYAVGTSGNYTRVIYQAKSGSRAYKLGYVTTSSYNNSVKPSVVPVPAPSSTAFDYPMKNAYCTWRTPGSQMSFSSYTNNSSNRDYHLGIDIWGSNNSVYSTADGKVVAVSNSTNGANGRYIIIQHTISGKTVYSFYAHLASVNVSKGQSVSRGTKIATAGGSGYGSNSYYGKHLHFAIVDTLWTNGQYYGYTTYFTGNKVKCGNVTFYNPVYVINNDRLPA